MKMHPEEAIMRIQDHMVVHHMAESPHCNMITEALKMSIEALDRMIPKKPICLRYLSTNEISWRCRGCHCKVKAGENHCSVCGQAIDWLAVYEDAKKGANNETVGN